MLTVTFFLVAGAFILTLMSAAGKTPLWVPVLLLTLVHLFSLLPQ